MADKKKVWFFRYDVKTGHIVQLPMTWFSFKRYYELNGKHSDKWEWIPPVEEYESVGWSIDDIVEEALSCAADVYMFSSYMWSWDIVKVVADAVRDKFPEAIIVLGGPHQGTTYASPIFWFKDYPYFDAACLPTCYGEYFITDMLDAIIEGPIDWNKIRNSFHRNGTGPQGNKLEFKFPTGVISSNIDIAREYSQRAKDTNRSLVINYETNRGCPYSCSYCEWGGGIGSKVALKDIEIIKDEISYWKELNIDLLYLNDANFGMIKRDVEIMQMFLDQRPVLKEIVIMGLAKTSNEKRLTVLEPLIQGGLIRSYGVSIQSLDPQVVKNIDRTDIPPEENVKLAKYLLDNYGINPNLEFILGLPGCKPETFYKEIEVDYLLYNDLKSGLFSSNTRTFHHFPLWVLPDSPAADPAYIEKFKMKLVPIGMETSSLNMTNKNKYVAEFEKKNYKKKYPMFTPVETYSYTTEDWKEMFFINDMSMVLINNHLLKPLIDFLYFHRNILPRDIYKKFHRIFTEVKEFYSPVEDYLNKMISGELGDISWRQLEVGPIGDSYSLYSALTYLWILNREELFSNIRKTFQAEGDPMLIDLLSYLENSTFRLEGSVEWTNKWRWDLWENSDKKVLPIEQGVTLKTEPFSKDQKEQINDLYRWVRNVNTQLIR